MSFPRLKAVLFDLDDTLLDWGRWTGDWRALERPRLEQVYVACQERGTPLNGSMNVFADYYRKQIMNAWSEARSSLRAPHLGRILLACVGHFGVPICEDPCETPLENAMCVQDCLDAFGKGYGEMQGVTVFPDVVDFLALLRERDIAYGIVTNASQPFSLRERELEIHGLQADFADSRCKIAAADVGYLKPHPRIFQHALELMGTQPEETIYIGDNPVADIAGAQSAGMRAVLRINHETPPLISGLVVPDSAINSFEELPAVFDEWYGDW